MADITTYQLVTVAGSTTQASVIPVRKALHITYMDDLWTPVQPVGLEYRTGLPYTLGSSVFQEGTVALKKLRGWNTLSSSYNFWTEGTATPAGVVTESITVVGLA